MKLALLALILFPTLLLAKPSVGENAPLFELRDQTGKLVRLADRKGKGWTVLFFYPKAGTPGCTKQACAFRDSIKVIRDRNAEVYGISADSVEAQAKFHKEHNLAFAVLADPLMDAIRKYGAKMEERDMAKRWTFILDPQLKVRWMDEKVDPVADPQNVANQLAQLQKP